MHKSFKMSNRLRGFNGGNKSEGNRGYDKFEEHMDQSPLGKIQRQYWTAKQHVIKKFGKKEDEFVVLSDAELDAKLDLFEAIESSSIDLLRVIEMYQDKIIDLSIEESDMSTFLKSESTYDTKTKAGKIMAAASKAQHFAAQQRNTLRLPLVRLYNEVETFRFRAISDTFLTVRKMENARTEYRGALLWMKNVSQELDPDASRKIEKFRRVQAQVKKTKTRFDKLKVDVTQKVDMLSASRCNMFSHVLVNYQRTLIMFWMKTARTFGAVAEAFKGYDHYEFNVIKDLVEPSKQLAKQHEPNLTEDSDSLLDQSSISSTPNTDTLINLKESEPQQDNQTNRSVDEVNELIDFMTLNEATGLNEQLKELELLEQEKKCRSSGQNNKMAASDFGPFTSSKPVGEVGATSETTEGDLVDLGALMGLKEIVSNAGDEFEREWQSACGVTSPKAEKGNTQLRAQLSEDNGKLEFDFFSQISEAGSMRAGESGDLMGVGNDCNLEAKKDSDAGSSKKNLSAWYDLFAELDPLKNPDAIGQNDGIDEQRNC